MLSFSATEIYRDSEVNHTAVGCLVRRGLAMRPQETYDDIGCPRGQR